MANLTTRTELAVAPAQDDLVHIVDVSDTTDAAGGTSKKIQLSKLFQAISSGDAGTRVVARIPVATYTDPVSGEFDFDLTNFQNGDKLVVSGDIRSTANAPDDFAYVYLNADTTAGNYHSQPALGANGSSFFVETANPRVYIQANGGTNTDPGTFRLEMTDYTGSNAKQMLVFHGMERNVDDCIAGFTYLSSSVTDAVTRIRIRTDNHSTDTLTGTLKCWIEREIVVAPGKHEIETIVADGTTITEFHFQNIPAGFKRLKIEGTMRSAGASTDSIYMEFNGDTTSANYARREDGSGGGGVASNQIIVYSTGNTDLADEYAIIDITIPLHSSAIRKTAIGKWSYYGRLGNMAWRWNNTAAVTAIKLRTDGGDALTGTVTLYAEY